MRNRWFGIILLATTSLLSGSGCAAVVPDWNARAKLGDPQPPSIAAWSAPRIDMVANKTTAGSGYANARNVTVFAVLRFPPREGHSCQFVMRINTTSGERVFRFPVGSSRATFRADWGVGHQQLSVVMEGCQLALTPRTVRFTIYPGARTEAPALDLTDWEG